MAKEKLKLLLLLHLPFLLLLLSLPSPSLSISETSLNAAISSLRSNGYTLFGNSILTSDLYTDLISNTSASFTFFAPTDPTLFTLDLSSRADSYVSSLRRHVAVGQLQSLNPPFPDAFPSLLPENPISISRNNEPDTLTANGVVIAAPGIFVGVDLTVHGLAGMLPVKFANPSSLSPISSSPPLDQPVETPPPLFAGSEVGFVGTLHSFSLPFLFSDLLSQCCSADFLLASLLWILLCSDATRNLAIYS